MMRLGVSLLATVALASAADARAVAGGISRPAGGNTRPATGQGRPAQLPTRDNPRPSHDYNRPGGGHSGYGPPHPGGSVTRPGTGSGGGSAGGSGSRPSHYPEYKPSYHPPVHRPVDPGYNHPGHVGPGHRPPGGGYYRPPLPPPGGWIGFYYPPPYYYYWSSSYLMYGSVAVTTSLVTVINAESGTTAPKPAATATNEPAKVNVDLASVAEAARPSASTCIAETARQIGATGGTEIRIAGTPQVEPGNGGYRFTVNLEAVYPDQVRHIPLYCRATKDKIIELKFG